MNYFQNRLIGDNRDNQIVIYLYINKSIFNNLNPGF